MNIVVLILVGIMVVMLYRKYQHAVIYRADATSRIFEDCLPLFEHAKQSMDKAKLPILSGHYDGYKVSISVVEDTLGWRKVPPLWLLVKVEAKVFTDGTLDYIVRPSNNEFYSPSWEWSGNLSIPSNWPNHAILKYQDRPVKDLTLLDPFVIQLFNDVNMKELLVMPKLTRLTYMVKQAERGEYLIMRNAIYENTPIASQLVETLLKEAVTIRKHIEKHDLTQINQAA
jgi:hypothetical protein